MIKNGWQHFLLHFVLIISIFIVLALLRWPILINSDIFLGSDEAFNAGSILGLLRGDPWFFYYEGERYHGILDGLPAIPLFLLLGVKSLAYKLPTVFYYALYIWTTWLIVRRINLPAAWIALTLMLFPPTTVIYHSTTTLPHTLICFLGNLIFLLYIRAKVQATPSVRTAFMLTFVIGLSIYSYTLSILHIATIVLLYALSHPAWPKVVTLFFDSPFRKMFRGLESKREILARCLDIVIALFLMAILFSLVFGGFAFDVYGYSILQIHNLYKPVYQALIIIGVRLVLFRRDLSMVIVSTKIYVQSIHSHKRKLISAGFAGLMFGLLPRLISIAMGETTRGGFGFTIDVPGKITQHAKILTTDTLPDILGFRDPLKEAFTSHSFYGSGGLPDMLLCLAMALIFVATGRFIWIKRREIIAISRFQSVKFQVALVFLLLPAFSFLAVIMSSNPPASRFLLPIFGVVAVYTSFFLDFLRKKSFMLFMILWLGWAGFYLTDLHRYYSQKSLLKGWTLVKREEPLLAVVEFLKSKNIATAYANYWIAYKATFLSGQTVWVSEFSKIVRGKKQKRLSINDPSFSIILKSGKEKEVYLAYLKKNLISYRKKLVGEYEIFWDFVGNKEKINGLRSLVQL